MKERLTAALSLLLLAANAAAYTDAGGRYTFGAGGYSGVSLFAEGGNDEYYLRGGLNTYISDGADRYSTYSAGAGVDRERWSASAEVSMTPETGGYKNTGLYADLGWNLVTDPEDGNALEDAVLGLFGAVTSHEDMYSLSTTTVSGSGRRTSVSSLTDSFKLSQRDYGLSASFRIVGVRLSGRYTMTSYDKDITAEARQLPVDIGGIGTSGFPSRAISARIKFAALPLSPEAGYARTSYMLDQPDSESVSAGLSLRTGPALWKLSWENFNPGGGAARADYYSAGLEFSF